MAVGDAAEEPAYVTSGQAGEALREEPTGKTLCGDPIGMGTTSVASRNLKSAAYLELSHSAKGKTDLSKMTCREMMTQFVEKSMQRYPLW